MKVGNIPKYNSLSWTGNDVCMDVVWADFIDRCLAASADYGYYGST